MSEDIELAAHIEQIAKKALFLSERVARTSPDDSDIEVLLEAGRRVSAWQSQSRLDAREFAEALATKGLDAESFVALLTPQSLETPEPLSRRSLAWAGVLQHVRVGTFAHVELPAFGRATRIEDQGELRSPPFGGFQRPFLQCALGLLQDKLGSLRSRSATVPSLSAEASEQLARSFVYRLTGLVGPTLILELNVARLRGQLRGSSARERYRDFSERVLDVHGILKILSEYAALGRLLCVTVMSWVEATAEFIERLATDRELVGVMA